MIGHLCHSIVQCVLPEVAQQKNKTVSRLSLALDQYIEIPLLGFLTCITR